MAPRVASHSGSSERIRTIAQRDVFLSPRIIDEGALRRYGDELRELARTLDDKAQTLIEVVGQAHRTRKELEQLATKEAAGMARANTLLESLASRAQGVDAALDRARRVESRAVELEAAALRTLSALREQCDRAERLAGDSLAHMIARAERAREQAERARSALIDPTARAEVVVGRLETLLEQLEPWREVLGGQSPTSEVPEPISQLVSQMRRDMATDIAAMAEAMSGIAQRAGGPPQNTSIVVRPSTESARIAVPPAG